MSTTHIAIEQAEFEQAELPCKPKRADARRNYEKIVTAAREAFAEHGTSASLEEITRRAGVGIGTLYRNFPNRQALLEAVYIEEVQGLSRAAAECAALDPWEGFSAWVRRLVSFLQAKQALAAELLDYMDRDSPLFCQCRETLFAAGSPLLERAQQAGVTRTDASIEDILHLFLGVAKTPGITQEQVDHIVGIALDGLRSRAA